uniref:Solute carrier family 40 protein n=1 Tax=Macrostomum lignano TaxID=282301 RepID=A0A1I8FMJ6_9PLAT
PTQPGMAAQVQIYDTLEDAMGAARGDRIVTSSILVLTARVQASLVHSGSLLLACIQSGRDLEHLGPFKRRNAVGLTPGAISSLACCQIGLPSGFVIALAPSLIIVNRCGLKVACLSGASLMAVGTVAPCFLAQSASFTEAFTIVCHIDALFCGLSCPVAMALPPALSAVWFPPGERILSTSVATLSNYSVAHLLYLECGLAFFSLLLFVAYFPAKPKLPSSASAQVNRLSFRDSLAQLLIGRGDNGGGHLFRTVADAAGFWSVLSAGLVCLPVALLSAPVEESIEALSVDSAVAVWRSLSLLQAESGLTRPVECCGSIGPWRLSALPRCWHWWWLRARLRRRNLADVAAESGDLLGEGDGKCEGEGEGEAIVSNDRDSLLPST